MYLVSSITQSNVLDKQTLGDIKELYPWWVKRAKMSALSNENNWTHTKCMKYLENSMIIFSPLRLKCLRILYKTSKGQKNDKT